MGLLFGMQVTLGKIVENCVVWLKSRTNRLKNSFFAKAVSVLTPPITTSIPPQYLWTTLIVIKDGERICNNVQCFYVT